MPGEKFQYKRWVFTNEQLESPMDYPPSKGLTRRGSTYGSTLGSTRLGSGLAGKYLTKDQSFGLVGF